MGRARASIPATIRLCLRGSMICPSCGLDNVDDAMFCRGCGAPLASSAHVAKKMPEATGANVSEESSSPRTPRRRRWPVVVIVVSSVILAVCAVAIAVSLLGRGEPSGSEQGRITVNSYELVEISFDEDDAPAEGEQVVTAQITLPDYEKLMANALEEDDPEAYLDERLRNGEYETVTVEREVTVSRSGDEVTLVDEDGVKESVLEQELIKAVNALDGENQK